MPQEFQVLQCYKCEKFQAHHTKKAKKWICKICGEKQSYIKVYYTGAAKECRFNVQKLNFSAGEKKAEEMLEKTFSPSEDYKNVEKFSFDENLSNMSMNKRIKLNPTEEEYQVNTDYLTSDDFSSDLLLQSLDTNAFQNTSLKNKAFNILESKSTTMQKPKSDCETELKIVCDENNFDFKTENAKKPTIKKTAFQRIVEAARKNQL